MVDLLTVLENPPVQTAGFRFLALGCRFFPLAVEKRLGIRWTAKPNEHKMLRTGSDSGQDVWTIAMDSMPAGAGHFRLH